MQDAKKSIEELGGSVTKTVNSADAMITTETEVKKNSDKVQGMWPNLRIDEGI